MTSDEFIAWAMEQPQRHELVRGEVLAMAPERLAHARVKGLIFRALGDAIRAAGLGCEALPDGMSVRVDDATVYEPDAVVRCGGDLQDDQVEIPNPLIVVEVLYPSTRAHDTSTRLADYFRLPTVRHYLIVDPGGRTVIHHRREKAERIEARVLRGGVGTLDLNPPGIAVLVEGFFP
jgi:Uma2 family endonuclease